MYIGDPVKIVFKTQPAVRAQGVAVKALQKNQQKKVLLATTMYDAGNNLCNNPDRPLSVALSFKRAPNTVKRQSPFINVTTSGETDFTQQLDLLDEPGTERTFGMHGYQLYCHVILLILLQQGCMYLRPGYRM